MKSSAPLFGVLIVLMSFKVLAFGAAASQQHLGFCDYADSTAASLKCLNDNSKKANEDLTQAIISLNDKMTLEEKSVFDAVQAKWIAYRDAQCLWESKKIKDEGLVRLYELACMIRITEDRVNGLMHVNDVREMPDLISEFGLYPRWFNVVRNTDKETLWTSQDRQSVDLNCDGEAEEIIKGYKYTKNESDGYDLAIQLAVANNPKIGKPSASFLNLPTEKKADEVSEDEAPEEGQGKELVLCGKNFTLRAVEEKQEEQDLNDGYTAQSEYVCVDHIVIEQESGTCEDIVLHAKDDKTYSLTYINEWLKNKAVAEEDLEEKN